jgi:hypothetical protein
MGGLFRYRHRSPLSEARVSRPPTQGGKRCRLHGGLSPGAPRGSRNGNYVRGDWTNEVRQERKWVDAVVGWIPGNRRPPYSYKLHTTVCRLYEVSRPVVIAAPSGRVP